MTFGQVKHRLTQMFPSVSLDLIEGWVNDRYSEILGELPWTRQNLTVTLAINAPYTTGTVAVAIGGTAVTLTGGTWDSTMDRRGFRVTGRNEFYAFTFLTSTTGTLDRAYEGPTVTAAGYSIFQNIYQLPSDCRMLDDDAFPRMQRFTHGQLNQTDPFRLAKGTPAGWASYMDDSSTPPLMQVEIYPIPDKAIAIPFTYGGDAGNLSATATILQVWIQPTALIEGAVARIKRHLKDYVGSDRAELAAKNALHNMRTSEAQGMAPAQMQMDAYFTRHRAKRWCR